ncbi:hypothetical protein D3C71_79650 [compost metagenome]
MLEILLIAGSSAGAGGPAFALFAGGQVGGAEVGTSVRYEFSTGAVTPSTNIGQARRFFSGAGNTTLGILQGGYSSINYGDKYTFSNHVVVRATNLVAGRSYNAATSTKTQAFWFGGWIGSGNGTLTIDRYTYATDTAANAANLNVARYGACVMGGASRAVIKGGYGSTFITNVESYSMSTGAQGSAAALPAGKAYACGTNTVATGYMFGGLISTGGVAAVVKHNHSNDAVTDGTNLTAAIYQSTAAGDMDMAIIAGGNSGGAITFANKYTYSDDVCVTTTVLAATSMAMAGCSSTPGNITA